MKAISKWTQFVAVFSLVIVGGLVSGCNSSETASISGSALYLEKIAMPPHAVFEATLEDVSRADAPAVILGTTTRSSFGQVPIELKIPFDPAEIKDGHRYNLRARITVDGKLKFITDTVNPVFPGRDEGTHKLIMKMVRGDAGSPNVSQDQAPFSNYPLHFLGLLPGANCENQYQLDLFSNNAYFLRTVCFKNGEAGKPQDDIGRWSFDGSTNRLVLTGGRDALAYFAVLDPKTIEKMDLNGKKIESELNYKLEDSRTAKTIEPHVFMHGMYQYMADAAVFQECLTGFKLPVIFEEDNASLERAYLKARKDPGEAMKVHVEASIVQRPPMEGAGTAAHLLVHHFIKMVPEQRCSTPYSTASFTNTYWRLTALNGALIGRDTPMLREAHLVFHNERDGEMRVAGSTGCNLLTGAYKINGQALSLAQDPLAMTMMACPEGNIETEFVAMLEDVKRWEISGEHLVLYGQDDSVAISRFEATYLR